ISTTFTEVAFPVTSTDRICRSPFSSSCAFFKSLVPLFLGQLTELAILTNKQQFCLRMKCPLEALDIIEFQAMQTGLYSLPHHFFFRGCLRLDSQRSEERRVGKSIDLCRGSVR